VRIWDLTTGTAIGDPLTGHTDLVAAVACTHLDGRPIAITGSWDHTVRIWDLTERAPAGLFPGHNGRVAAVACAQLDGSPIAVTGGWDHTVRIWDLTSGIPIGLFSGHTGRITAVACARLDGCPIAITGSWDHTVRIWDLRRRHGTDRIDLPNDVKAVSGTPAGGIVAAFGRDIVLLERSTERLT
jgi:WD40 repeat protein